MSAKWRSVFSIQGLYVLPGDGLYVEAAAAGEVRQDVPPSELATFCLAAMAGVRNLGSDAAVFRLVSRTYDAIGATAPTDTVNEKWRLDLPIVGSPTLESSKPKDD